MPSREGNGGLGLLDPLWRGLELGEGRRQGRVLGELGSGLRAKLGRDLTAAVAMELNLQP